MEQPRATWHGADPEHLARLSPVSLRARDLVSLICLRGGGTPPDMSPALPSVLERVESMPDILLTLTSAFDCRGGPHQFPREDSPYERRLDLHVLQRLGLSPGDTRPARWLFARMAENIPTLDGLCVFSHPTERWPSWPPDAVAAYGRGLSLPLAPVQTPEASSAAKTASVAEIVTAERLCLRPHHILCILCYYGRETDAPLEIDNLWEPLVRMRDDPDIEVTLVEGDCMVCPPCHSFDPASGICVGACGLRDRRKDLDTLQRLDLLPGDTLKARDLLRLYVERIPEVKAVCDYGEATAWEWRSCGGSHTGAYEHGLQRLREWL
ncbi:MAG: hypothetical protein HPY69_17965 [Armatimonadetes bacterium]|nr:hypothetical protein [Armatimonadota bacterium]